MTLKLDSMVYITGHKNPDTDSICSVIAYSEFKKKFGVNAVPVRLGDLNKETEFILNYFDVEVPEQLYTVKTQVSDLVIDVISPVSPYITIKTAWNIMKKHNVRILPVVDENEKFVGIITLSDIFSKYMDALDSNISYINKTPLINIVETLNAKLLCGSSDNYQPTGNVVIAATAPDEMANYINKGDIVITGGRKDSLVKSIELGANCIIITCGAQIDQDTCVLAEKSKAVLMVTELDTFTTARLINQSVPIGYVMTKGRMIKFNINDFVEEVKDKMLSTRYRSYPVVDGEGKIKGFISRYHLISPRSKKVILLDHNEHSQSIDGIEQAEILEIIDHHRLGDIQTMHPVYFKNEPLGSTSTIIANMFFEAGITPPKKIAGIMCAAIISDTIKFESPTSTYTDRTIAEKLANIAEFDIDEFAMQMFKAGSTMFSEPPEEVLQKDFKEFKFGKYRIGIAQVYTIDFGNLENSKESLVSHMEELCRRNGYNLVILVVTDILRQGSEILYAGNSKEIISKAFHAEANGSGIYLPGVVSRKKQIIPRVSTASM